MTGFESEVILVADASSRLGELFVDRFVAAGAGRVYAGGRRRREWPGDRVVAVEIDMGDVHTIERAGVAVQFDTNVMSSIRLASAFALSQAALWSATNALRVEFAPAGVQVAGLVLGPCEADAHPATVADRALAGIAAREHEILVDAFSKQVRARLSGPVACMYPELGSP
ncbi:hypothetical protein GCM10009557_36080 [Virgisporangium ochraceum]|uniref:Short-chain dehydrogenase/reductase SDR n=1 Tax=Virgisporangium ochraceum TaxID=65505 RepID=A0A8J3ZRW9_9ACTN|nr:hypothetical protein [Virgisporangium ochraceum]GIJ67912.1 hypothetical protein Voc01_028290 [Virgisporangium ochraceum]